MWTSYGRSAIRQKLGRDTHPERKVWDVFSKAEEHSKSEARSPAEIHTWRGVPASWMRSSTVKRDVNCLQRTILLGILLPLANYLVSFFTPDWSMDPYQYVCTTFF